MGEELDGMVLKIRREGDLIVVTDELFPTRRLGWSGPTIEDALQRWIDERRAENADLRDRLSRVMAELDAEAEAKS